MTEFVYLQVEQTLVRDTKTAQIWAWFLYYHTWSANFPDRADRDPIIPANQTNESWSQTVILWNESWSQTVILWKGCIILARFMHFRTCLTLWTSLWDWDQAGSLYYRCSTLTSIFPTGGNLYRILYDWYKHIAWLSILQTTLGSQVNTGIAPKRYLTVLENCWRFSFAGSVFVQHNLLLE